MKLQAIFRNGAFRLGLWAAFIILAAALARLATLNTAWIIGVIAIAWVLVAVMERSLQRTVAAEGDPSATVPAAAPAAPSAPAAPARKAPKRASAAPKPAPRDPSLPDPDDWLVGSAEINPGPPPAVRAPAPARAPAAPAPIVTIPAAPRSADVAAAAPVQPPVERSAGRSADSAVAAADRAAAAAIAPLAPAVVRPRPMLSPLPRRGPAAGQGSWNLWDIERLARDAAGTDRGRDEERSLILMYLREFANSEGMLGHEFDDLVRESFGDLLPQW